jgi:hypothetical protein
VSSISSCLGYFLDIGAIVILIERRAGFTPIGSRAGDIRARRESAARDSTTYKMKRRMLSPDKTGSVTILSFLECFQSFRDPLEPAPSVTSPILDCHSSFSSALPSWLCWRETPPESDPHSRQREVRCQGSARVLVARWGVESRRHRAKWTR